VKVSHSILVARSSVRETVHAIIRQVYFKGHSSNAISFDDSDTLLLKLGLDSLEIIQIVVAIEKAFKISIDDEELQTANFKTVGSLTQWVQMLLHKTKR